MACYLPAHPGARQWGCDAFTQPHCSEALICVGEADLMSVFGLTLDPQHLIVTLHACFTVNGGKCPALSFY